MNFLTYVSLCISELCILFHQPICLVWGSGYHNVLIIIAFKGEGLKIVVAMIPPALFFSRLLWLFGVLLLFHVDFEIVCSCSRIVQWNLQEVAFHLQIIQYGCHFNNVLITRNIEYLSNGVIFSFFYQCIRVFSVYRSLTSVVEYIPSYFIFHKIILSALFLSFSFLVVHY